MDKELRTWVITKIALVIMKRKMIDDVLIMGDDEIMGDNKEIKRQHG